MAKKKTNFFLCFSFIRKSREKQIPKKNSQLNLWSLRDDFFFFVNISLLSMNEMRGRIKLFFLQISQHKNIKYYFWVQLSFYFFCFRSSWCFISTDDWDDQLAWAKRWFFSAGRSRPSSRWCIHRRTQQWSSHEHVIVQSRWERSNWNWILTARLS